MTIPADEVVNLGESEIIVDKRLMGGTINDNSYYVDIENGRVINPSSIFTSTFIGDKLAKKKINFTNLPTGVTIKEVESVEDREYYGDITINISDSVKHKRFTEKKGTLNGESIIPHGIELTQIGSKFIGSLRNSDIAKYNENRFKLVGSDGKYYTGNFKEKIVGEEAKSGEAILAISGAVGTKASWKIGATGKVEGTTDDTKQDNEDANAIKYVLDFSDGELFNFKAATELGITDMIIDSMNVKVNNSTITPKITATEARIETDYHDIIFKGDELIIEKKKYNDQERVYEIEAYNTGILLGKLKLTIPKEVVDLGEATFKIDKRLEDTKVQSVAWVFPDKSISQLTGIYRHELPNMIATETTGLNKADAIVRRVVEAVDRPHKSAFYTNSKLGVEYVGYRATPSVYDDTGAFPVYINLQDLEKYMVVCTINKSPNLLNNRFKVLGYDGKLYTVNIKEKYVGAGIISAEGEIDFTRVAARSAKWKPNSTGASDNKKISIKFSGGAKKVFDTTGVITNTNVSIADKLVIKDGTGVQLKTATLNNGKLRAELSTGEAFEIESDGTVIIQGRKEKGINTFKIEAYYGVAKLGELTLTLKTGNGVKIEGDDRFDFGIMQKDKKYSLDGKILVKNENALNVTVDIPKSAKMIHTTDSSKEIPFTIDSTQNKVGDDVETRMILEAKTAPDQQTGKYEGQFMITVTIND